MLLLHHHRHDAHHLRVSEAVLVAALLLALSSPLCACVCVCLSLLGCSTAPPIPLLSLKLISAPAWFFLFAPPSFRVPPLPSLLCSPPLSSQCPPFLSSSCSLVLLLHPPLPSPPPSPLLPLCSSDSGHGGCCRIRGRSPQGVLCGSQ